MADNPDPVRTYERKYIHSNGPKRILRWGRAGGIILLISGGGEMKLKLGALNSYVG